MRTHGLKSFLLIFLALLLHACATAPTPVADPPPPAGQNLLAATDDLAMVSDEALQLAERYGNDRILVVFDIDNTLLAMEQDLGSDQWYYWQKDLAAEDPCSHLLVSDRLRAQGALYYASAMRTTQEDAALQVYRLQQAGVPVIAVTSRGPEFSLHTFRELRRNGISFWPTALPPARGYPERFIPEGGTLETLYQDGVFLTAGQDKGIMFKALLSKSGFSPEVIVLVDDKPENLQAVMEIFRDSNTLIHAWRYSREDATVALFDPQEAAAQWDAAEPALTTLQQVFGPDNFDLPPEKVEEGCRNSDQ